MVKFNTRIFFVLFFIYFVIWGWTSNYYESISMSNKPDDGNCDINGNHRAEYVLETIYYFGGKEVETKQTHEYCNLHAGIFSIIHPLQGILTKNDYQKQMLGASMIGLMIWVFLIGLAILLSIFPWSRLWFDILELSNKNKHWMEKICTSLKK